MLLYFYIIGKDLIDVNYNQTTYISPAGDFQADGARTGKYISDGEKLTRNLKGESVISHAGYAAAMVDEVLNGNHVQQRITVVSE